MSFPQITSSDGRVALDVGARRARLLMDGQKIAGFDVRHEETLTANSAGALADLDPGRWIVAFWRASPAARELLRERGICYAGAAGELYIHAPPVHLEVPAPRRRGSSPPPQRSVSPFGIRASRVPRWMLLHSIVTPSIRELAKQLSLSESIVSRTARMLSEEGFTSIEHDPKDARLRRLRLNRPGQLLDALERATADRRIRRSTWDIGSPDPQQTLVRLGRAAKRLPFPYALGGLSGASHLRPNADPMDVEVWIGRDEIDLWAEALHGEPSQRGRGTVTLQVAPDPFVISLATRTRGLWVADPVQLYLDCRRSGERALDAAEAIRAEMRW